jgi:hypothetical protein
MGQILAYHIVKDLCDEMNIRVRLVPGYTKNYTAFLLEKDMKLREFFDTPKRSPLRTRGSCRGTIVTIGMGNSNREFDLHDPKSISGLRKWLKSDRCWR